jgi:hypothetical protein
VAGGQPLTLQRRHLPLHTHISRAAARAIPCGRFADRGLTFRRGPNRRSTPRLLPTLGGVRFPQDHQEQPCTRTCGDSRRWPPRWRRSL